MIRMFVRHPVAAFEVWKAAYDAFAPARDEMGVQGAAVFQSAEDPNDVTLWHDFDSTEQARAFLESPRLHEAMASAGVQGEPTTWFTSPA